MTIASKSQEEHLQHLKILFECLLEHDLSLNTSKCIFGVLEIDLLGHCVTETAIECFLDPVNVINDFPLPKSLIQLQRFLWMYNFYRRFIPRAAHILASFVQF